MSTLGRYVSIAIIAAGAAFPMSAYAVNCCSVNGGSCNIIPPLTHGDSGWTGSVCGTTLTGTNCVAKLDADVATNTGSTCITLGSGVTLDLNGFTMDCTLSPPSTCGDAIKNTGSSGASGAVEVTNGYITGRWSNALEVTGGTNSRVSSVWVVGAITGFNDVRGPIDRSLVGLATTGIVLHPSEDISSTKLAANQVGVLMGYYGGASYTGSSLDNVLFDGNNYSIQTAAATAAGMQRSELLNATACHCYNGSTCVSEASCVSITNSTTPTWVNDGLVP